MKARWIRFGHSAAVLALAVLLCRIIMVGGSAKAVSALSEHQAQMLDPAWHLEQIDTCDAQVLARNIALDASGHVHVVYACNRLLRYATWDGSTWIYRTYNMNVDLLGQSLDFVLGSDGVPRILYIAVQPGETSGVLHYQTVTAAEWSDAIVDPGFSASGVAGCEVSLALDGINRPHIAYGDTPTLKYAFLNGGSWSIQTVNDNVDAEICTALDVTSSGAPHVVFHDISPTLDGLLRYAVPSATGWQVTTVDRHSDLDLVFGQPSGIRLDGAGVPHVLYADYDAQALRYAVLTSTGWSKQTIATGLTVDRTHRGSLALSSSGAPHITFAREGGTDLIYVRQAGNSWIAEVLNTNGLSPAVAVERDVYIAHLPTIPGTPTLAIRTFVPASWTYLPYIAVQ